MEKTRKRLLDGVDAHWRHCSATSRARLPITEDFLLAELHFKSVASTETGLSLPRRPTGPGCGTWRRRLSLGTVIRFYACKMPSITLESSRGGVFVRRPPKSKFRHVGSFEGTLSHYP